MAAKDRTGTTSLHGLMASGGDTIPKEYHRKLLKKIAQLTKVPTSFGRADNIMQTVALRYSYVVCGSFTHRPCYLGVTQIM